VDFADAAAHNEEVFRSINERIEEGAKQHGVEQVLPFHCECATEVCLETIELPPAEYDRIASHRAYFVVIAGHEQSSVENVQTGPTLTSRRTFADAGPNESRLAVSNIGGLVHTSARRPPRGRRVSAPPDLMATRLGPNAPNGEDSSVGTEERRCAPPRWSRGATQ
jgi:hypothetical protein